MSFSKSGDPALPSFQPSKLFSQATLRAKLAWLIWTVLQIYPLDAVFDTPDDVPEAVKTNKRYAGLSGYTISEVRQPTTFPCFFVLN